MNLIRSDKSTDKFSTSYLCSSCTHTCCEGIDCPPVFPNDIKKLQKIGKNESDYIQTLQMTSEYNIKQIKRKPGTNQCIFYDSEKKQCSIYQYRPLDCQMYPFDINVINGEPWWVILSCNPNSDWSWTEKHLQNLEEKEELSELIESVYLYEIYVNLGFDDRSKYRIPLRKVNYTSTHLIQIQKFSKNNKEKQC